MSKNNNHYNYNDTKFVKEQVVVVEEKKDEVKEEKHFIEVDAKVLVIFKDFIMVETAEYGNTVTYEYDPDVKVGDMIKAKIER